MIGLCGSAAFDCSGLTWIGRMKRRDIMPTEIASIAAVNTRAMANGPSIMVKERMTASIPSSGVATSRVTAAAVGTPFSTRLR